MIRNVCITCVIWLEGECAARVRWPRLKVLHYHKLAVKDWSILLPSEIILGSVAKQRQWCNFSWWLKMFFPHFAQLALPASYCLGRKGSCGNFCTFHNLDNALCFHAIFLGIVHCAQTQWLLCRHTHNCKIFTEAIASVIYILRFWKEEEHIMENQLELHGDTNSETPGVPTELTHVYTPKLFWCNT